jgi:hypothetical protein
MWGPLEILDVPCVIFDLPEDADELIQQCLEYDAYTTIRSLRDFLCEECSECYEVHRMDDEQVIYTTALQMNMRALDHPGRQVVLPRIRHRVVVKGGRHGRAQVNALQLRQTLNHLRDVLVNGTLPDILPHDPAVIKQLQAMGILSAKGHEIFYNCVVFPLYDGQGVVSGLYGRNIGTDAVAHLYLAGPRTGIVNRQAVKRSQTIF